jgi:DNA-binding NarL/FixJ family response regulator
MNGIPAELHTGKTIREVIGSIASTVELMLRSVLFTGTSILNVEIRGNLPTRKTEGCWIEHYFPVRNSTGRVTQVGVVVVEITGMRRLENSILALFNNTGRMRGQRRKLGQAYALEERSAQLCDGSIESLENSLREGLKNAQALNPLAQTPSTSEVVSHQEISFPYTRGTITDESNRHTHALTREGSNGVKALSPRETQLVRLLARGMGNKEISTTLNISVKTVEAYRARVMLKLQIHSLSDLILYAVRYGLVKP